MVSDGWADTTLDMASAMKSEEDIATSSTGFNPTKEAELNGKQPISRSTMAVPRHLTIAHSHSCKWR